MTKKCKSNERNNPEAGLISSSEAPLQPEPVKKENTKPKIEAIMEDPDENQADEKTHEDPEDEPKQQVQVQE